MSRKRTYTDDEKQTARRLLIIHGGDTGIVHGLTGIPRRTLYDWRTEWNDDYDAYFEAFAQKIRTRANAVDRAQILSEALDADDSDSNDPGESFAQFTQLRQILMGHLMTLSTNLLTGDEHINQRTIAITRLLDRVLQLDDILPDHNPEKVIRFEYLYEGSVHKVPPWSEDARRPENIIGPIPEDYES